MMPVFASWADSFVAVELGDSRGKEKQCTGGKSCSAKSPLSGFEIHNNESSTERGKKTKNSKQNLFFWLDMSFLRIKVTCAGRRLAHEECDEPNDILWGTKNVLCPLVFLRLATATKNNNMFWHPTSIVMANPIPLGTFFRHCMKISRLLVDLSNPQM